MEAGNGANNEGQAPTEQKVKPEGPTHVQLKVVDAQGYETVFKVKRNMPLRRLMQEFLKRTGKDEGSLRFMYEDTHIKPEHTPESLGMEDDDVIDACVQQTGGCMAC
ncbi:hypothetical protein GQ42DRAFT_19056 [Ramicandelaber brevisporus]|nr:hypothetical protein GQ42DRAFT_19056 [Ramicandelaber brevisporus]